MKRHNPSTSTDALKSLRHSDLNRMYKKILDGLDIIGNGTFEEIAAKIGENREKVWKRLSELEKMGLLYRPGDERKLKSGRNGKVWYKTHPAKTEKEIKGNNHTEWHIKDAVVPVFVQPQIIFP